MITELFIQNFTIIEKTQISFQAGMTVLTGETGAGKSILLDALGLLLGNRANTQWIRPVAEQADISAIFHIEDQPAIQQHLKAESFPYDDELIIRRILNTEGRTKALINGIPATVQQLKNLAPLLVHVHGQHDHHALLKPQHQLDNLDAFAQQPAATTAVKAAYQTVQQTAAALETARQQAEATAAQQELLTYQVTELDSIALGEQEYAEINALHQQLTHAQALITGSQQLVDALQDAPENALLDQLARQQQELETLATIDPQLHDTTTLLNEAQIALQEACNTLKHYHERLDVDPEQQQHITQRLQTCLELARKHQVSPAELYTHHQALQAQLAALSQHSDHLEALQQAYETAQTAYQTAARTLSQHRQTAAKTLGKAVTTQLKTLGFPYGEFVVELQYDATRYQPHGSDQIQFQVRTNQGQPLQPMQTVVSGGELSRISLAIQMLTAAQKTTPTLIFDEVDTGVGGAIAEVIGQLLHQLGDNCQVLCVTHLAQIAAQARQHLHISKSQTATNTHSTVAELDESTRIEEIARMLGGIKVTEQTLAHAREILQL